MSGDVLVKAADYLDEVLAEATRGTWVPWGHVDLQKGCRCGSCYQEAWAWEVDSIDGPACRSAKECNHVMHLEWGDAAYISAMHPQVGKALAAWLRAVSELKLDWPEAHAVAQAILRAAA